MGGDHRVSSTQTLPGGIQELLFEIKITEWGKKKDIGVKGQPCSSLTIKCSPAVALMVPTGPSLCFSPPWLSSLQIVPLGAHRKWGAECPPFHQPPKPKKISRICDLCPKLQLFAGVCVCGLNSDQYLPAPAVHTQGKQHFWRTDVCAYLNTFL